MIAQGASKPKERLLFIAIKEALVEGSTFFEVVYSTRQFSEYDCATLKIGEQTGQLSSVMSQLSEYYSKMAEHKRLLLKAVSYPLMVLTTAIGALIFMLSFVVPMFEDIFMRSGDELPLFTQFIIKISVFFREDFVLVLGGLLFFALVFYLLKGSKQFQFFFSVIVLKTPLLGRLIKLYYLKKLFHSFALLSKAKVSVHESLVLVKEIIGFGPLKNVMSQVYIEVMDGASLAASTGKSGFFENRMILMIKIGEEVKRLDEIFEKLYQQLSNDLEHRINQFGVALEPILIILVGLLVGFILIAMYLPIFQLGTSVF